MTNIIRKAIAFNLDDPYQKELYEHVCKFKNFSYYGKTLVQRDYEKSKVVKNPSNGIKFEIK